jgi:hypothetical protein
LGDDGITAGTAAVAVVQRTHDARDALHLSTSLMPMRAGTGVGWRSTCCHHLAMSSAAADAPRSEQQLAGLWFGRLITGRVS